MRGDYDGGRGQHGQEVGPSPRAWGLPVPGAGVHPGNRSIPTCVGTTHLRGVRLLPGRSIPRAWGLLGLRRGRGLGDGPSPRAWGLRTTKVTNLNADGPSPRAWGLQASSTRALTSPRSIPTCVGTTPRGPGAPGGPTVHPHVRGDYGGGRNVKAMLGGPSPRAWGLLEHLQHGSPDQRAIPTCVGTTATGSTANPRRTGHPHVRGDYGLEPPRGSYIGGPSPRAWGLRASVVDVSGYGRAIPTCVGTTKLPQN